MCSAPLASSRPRPSVSRARWTASSPRSRRELGRRLSAMKRLSMQLGVRGRLYALVGLFAAGSVALAVTLIWLQGQRAIEARRLSLQQLTEVATGVLAAHKKLADAGIMTVEEAKKRALAVLNEIRYGQGDYFFVRDPEGVTIIN